ncbi:hypothetical protein AGMMS49975_01210 [Clostridia bacterium]|nr:hypothetical protein AGMMS49975_01210 [Clostridia bacterium]
MFVLKRNQIIITALVVMVAVAGYLNYVDTEKSRENGIALNENGDVAALIPSGTDTVGKDDLYTDFGDGLFVNADDNPAIASNADETDPGTAVFVSSQAFTDDSYFIQAKLDREQARSKQKEILTDMINNGNIEQGKRTECAGEMLALQKRIEKETAAEAMIESKGFSEVYVRIDDDTVDVVVSKAQLSDAEIAQIEDIVKRKTGVTADKIRISPVKK